MRGGEWNIQVSKTGFIREAGKCLVMLTTIASRPIVIVLLDSYGKLTRVGDANRVKYWLETGEAMPVPVLRAVKAVKGVIKPKHVTKTAVPKRPAPILSRESGRSPGLAADACAALTAAQRPLSFQGGVGVRCCASNSLACARVLAVTSCPPSIRASPSTRPGESSRASSVATSLLAARLMTR